MRIEEFNITYDIHEHEKGLITINTNMPAKGIKLLALNLIQKTSRSLMEDFIKNNRLQKGYYRATIEVPEDEDELIQIKYFYREGMEGEFKEIEDYQKNLIYTFFVLINNSYKFS